MIKIFVIIGSIRPNRFGDKPAQWIVEALKKQQDVEVELIDIRELQLPMFDEPVSPASNKGEYVHPEGVAWAKKVAEADGFVIVTPEYNHGYPPSLKNALDYVYYGWNKKPVGFVSYGGISGGIRAVQQLRQVVIELQMVPIRGGVYIPFFRKLLDEEGAFHSETLVPQAEPMIEQLLWWAKVLKKAREA